MIPVAIHKIFGGVGLGLVQSRVAVGRCLKGAVFDGADIYQAALIRGELELRDAVGHVTEFLSLAEFVAFQRGFPNLGTLNEENAFAVKGPARVAYALRVAGKLDAVAAVDVAQKQIAAAAVVLYRIVRYTIENLCAVR